VIDVRGLRFCYGKDFTLSIDSLKLPEKGFVSLIGPNGSGKTTFLRIASGLLKGFEGDMLVDGIRISEMSPEKIAEKIAYVPVYVRPDNPVSVRELILSGAYRYGGSADIQPELELCGLEKMAGKSVFEISSGEMKRVLIARALVQKTGVIVMDEPFANLDPGFEVRIMDIIKDISRTRLVVAAVHNVTIASVVSDYVCGIKDGGLNFFTKNSPDQKMLKELYNIDFISVQNHPFPDYFNKN